MKRQLGLACGLWSTTIWDEWLTRRSLSALWLLAKSVKSHNNKVKSHLYGLESTTSALILSIFGLWSSWFWASSTAHCFCLHFINSFSNSLTRSFSSSTVAIRKTNAAKQCERKGYEWKRKGTVWTGKSAQKVHVSTTKISCLSVCSR